MTTIVTHGEAVNVREKRMTTYNYLANGQYVAGYRSGIAAKLRWAKPVNRLLGALRGSVGRVLSSSIPWRRLRDGLDADTRQIRNYDLSKQAGACEVRQGLCLAS